MPALPTLKAFLTDVVDQVADTARGAPLIVVPGNDFDQGSADYKSHGRIHERGARTAAAIGRDQFVFFVSQVTLERVLLRRFFQGGVDLFLGSLFLNLRDQVDNRYVGSRNAHGETVEFAGHLGNDKLQRLSCASRGWNHRERGGPGAP